MGRFCGFNVKLGTGICGSGYNFSKFTRILYIDSCKSSKSHKICDARLCHHFSEFFVCLYICLYMDPPKLEYDNPITWGIFKFQFWVKLWFWQKSFLNMINCCYAGSKLFHYVTFLLYILQVDKRQFRPLLSVIALFVISLHTICSMLQNLHI